MNQGAGPPSLSLSGREPATGRGGAASCVSGGRPLARRPESRRAGMSAPHIVASGPSVRPAPTHRNAASGLHDTVPPLIGRPPRSPLPSLYSLCQLFLSTQLPNCQLIPLRYKARGQDEPSAVPSRPTPSDRPGHLPRPQGPSRVGRAPYTARSRSSGHYSTAKRHFSLSPALTHSSDHYTRGRGPGAVNL